MSRRGAGHGGGARRSLTLVAALMAVVASIVGSASQAAAAFAAQGSAGALVSAASVPAPASLAVQDGKTTVQVGWATAMVSTGVPASSYVVKRTVGAVTTQICTTSASALTCSDARPTQATTYSVVAKYGPWTGAPATVAFAADTTPPVTTAVATPAPNANGWIQATSAVVYLAATDTGSGVQSIWFRINGGATGTLPRSSVNLLLNEQGTTSIEYWSTDVMGNVESHHTVVYRLDGSAAPASALTLSSDTGSSSSDLVTKTPSQTLSGLAEADATVVVVYNGQTRTTTASAAGAWSVSVNLVEGAKTVGLTVTDPAGNTATSSAQLTLDTVLPTATVASLVAGATYTDASWQQTCTASGAPGVCGSSSDALSGVAAVSAELQWVDASNPFWCWTGAGWNASQCGTYLPATSGPSPWWLSVPTQWMPRPTVPMRIRLTVRVADVAGNQAVVAFEFFKRA